MPDAADKDRGKRYSRETFQADALSGITILVTSVPVGIGLGIASGMGAVAGLWCIVIVGFVAALFGGTKALMSGPSAALAVAVSVILAGGATSLGEVAIIVILAGAFQILFGVLRAGRFVGYIPHVVLQGFISGVGILLCLSQVPTVLGTGVPAGGAVAMVSALPAAVRELDPDSVTIAAVALAFLVFWPRSLERWAPSFVVALVGASILGAFWFDRAAVLGPLPSGLPDVHLEVPSIEFVLGAIEPALLLALIGSIYTLILALTADSITGAQHDPNRELIAQGLGNMTAGVLGAMPGAANPDTLIHLRAGGRTVVAAFVRTGGLLALLLALGHLTASIPVAAFAAILIKVGWSIVDWRLLARLRRLRPEYAAVMLLTLGLTVLVSPLTAVALGLVATAIVHAARLEGLELYSVKSAPVLDQTILADDNDGTDADPFGARGGILAFQGALTVASSRKLIRMVGADIRDHEFVIVDFSAVTHIDDSAAHVFMLLMDLAARERTDVVVAGVSPDVGETLRAFDALRRVPEEHIVSTLEDALSMGRQFLKT